MKTKILLTFRACAPERLSGPSGQKVKSLVVEDLAVQNMVKNRSLARSISDAGWGELVRQLEYKSDWYGRELIKIDRFYPSSKRCRNCGFVIDKLLLNVREWECPQCKTTHDRDINAAQNILAALLIRVSLWSEHKT